jgi:tetratricopeptide (TPR) repeat protein
LPIDPQSYTKYPERTPIAEAQYRLRLDLMFMVSNHNRALAEDHYYAALDLFADGKHDEAVTAYRRAIDADPSFTDAMHGLTRAYQDMERFDDAIAIAKRIAAVDPEDILAHTSLSILYQRKGMITEAEAEANKARILGWKKELLEKKRSGL